MRRASLSFIIIVSLSALSGCFGSRNLDLGQRQDSCGAQGPCASGMSCEAGVCVMPTIPDDDLGEGPRSGPRVVQLAVGEAHTCALLDHGRVQCWGGNEHGQLGDGTRFDRDQPVDVIGLEDVVAISSGFNLTKTFALHRDGTVSVWGRPNSYSGDPSPARIAGLSNVKSLMWGGDTTCVLHRDGALSCATSDRLEDGSYTTRWERQALTDVVQLVSSALGHICALRARGEVWCWGSHLLAFEYDEALGHVVQNVGQLPAPERVALDEPATSITLGAVHACAKLESGRAVCWGADAGGQFDLPFSPNSPYERLDPREVPQLGEVSEVFAGRHASCGLRPGQGLRCVGMPYVEPLVTPEQRVRVVDMPQLADAVEVVMGANHACARTRSGRVWCWGDNTQGQIGDGRSAVYPEPALVQGLRGVTELATGPQHTCARAASGEVSCWGANELALFDAPQTRLATLPVVVPDASGWTQLVTGRGYLCGLAQGGEVRCRSLELGSGNSSNVVVAAAQAVEGVAPARALSGGERHLCALHLDGGVTCWGDNTWGQLVGVEDRGPDASRPQRVPMIDDATQLVTGRDYNCALSQRGEVWCWGAIHPRTSRVSRPVLPSRVEGLADVVELVAARDYRCARRAAGEVHCWTDNDYVHASMPNQQAGLLITPPRMALTHEAVALMSGAKHTCAQGPAGEVTCWGSTASGQLGAPELLGARDAVEAPVAVSHPAEVSLSSAHEHVCEIVEGGQVRCWGQGKHGQLGRADVPDALTPKLVRGAWGRD